MPRKKKTAKSKKRKTTGRSLEDAILLLADDVLKRLAEFGQNYGLQEQHTSLTRPECAAITMKVKRLEEALKMRQEIDDYRNRLEWWGNYI